MGSSENMNKLRRMLHTFADLIRQGEGIDSLISVSQMREKIAEIDLAKFTISNGAITGHTVQTGSTDPSTPTDSLEYFERLLTNFADRVRVGSEKLDVDDIET